MVIKFLGNYGVGYIPTHSCQGTCITPWLSSFLVSMVTKFLGNYCVHVFPMVIKFLGNHCEQDRIHNSYQVSWSIVQDVFSMVIKFLGLLVTIVQDVFPIVTKFLGILCRMYSPWLSSFLVYCVGCIPHSYQVSWSIVQDVFPMVIKFLGLTCVQDNPWLSSFLVQWLPSFLVYCVGCIPHGYQVLVFGYQVLV